MCNNAEWKEKMALHGLTSVKAEQLQEILEAVVKELGEAMAKHPLWPVNVVHGAAIVGEQAGELVRAALHEAYGLDNGPALRQEAIQTAAMAIRFLLNLGEMLGMPSVQVEDKP